MSLRDVIESDLSVTLEGDFQSPVFVTDSEAVEHEIKGQVIRIDAMIDPMTNQLVPKKQTGVTVRTSSLPFMPVRKVTPIRCFDITGQEITGTVDVIREDAAIGFTTMVIDRKQAFAGFSNQ